MKKYITLGTILIALVLIILFAIYYPFKKTRTSNVVTTNNLSADAYPIYPDLTWGKENPQTINDISGFEIVSAPVINISDLSAVSTPFLKYYENKLALLGWIVDNSLAAGGPGSEIVAYKKGSEYIILKFTTVFKGGAANEPVQCPCDMTFSIFSGSQSQATHLK